MFEKNVTRVGIFGKRLKRPHFGPCLHFSIVSRIGILFLVLAFIFLKAPNAYSLESAAVVSPRAHVTLITSDDIIAVGKSFYIGLRFQLTDGWHVYWSNPGDAGQPPSLHLHVPDGIKNSEIEWPTPIRLREGPAMVYAYTGDVTLPVTVNVPASYTGKNLVLDVDADWLVCADHCIPERGHFTLSLPIGTEHISKEASLINTSLARLPKPPTFDLSVTDPATLTIKYIGKNIGKSPETIQDAWFFPDQWGLIENAAPQKLVSHSDDMSLILKPGPLFKAASSLSGLLVLKDMSDHEDYYTITAPKGPSPISPHGSIGWAETLFFALLGGLILNLMPCVFPVLAIKALSLIRLSNTKRRHVQKQALFYTLGILVAFGFIDGVLLLLRTAGQTVGWGFQFQSPTFVTCMSWLLFVLGLNLSGVFIVGYRTMGIGESYANQDGVSGSFFTGLLAVIVATPCVAPFLGAAIASAVTAPPFAMLTIFLVMGLGLALPYALLTLFPEAIRLLPRPGPWMDILKQGLAFPMYAASAWLLWVLTQQAGSMGLADALVGILLIGMTTWLYGQVKPKQKSGMAIRAIMIFLCFCGALLCLYHILFMPAFSSSTPSLTSINEERFSPSRLAELQTDGQPVFVDMTAAWCITCLVNERVAIAPAEVQAAFAHQHVVYLKGDWTQEDPAITTFLKSFGSDGVPLYVFYPSQHGEPIVLPQILTPSIVLQTLDQPPT